MYTLILKITLALLHMYNFPGYKHCEICKLVLHFACKYCTSKFCTMYSQQCLSANLQVILAFNWKKNLEWDLLHFSYLCLSLQTSRALVILFMLCSWALLESRYYILLTHLPVSAWHTLVPRSTPCLCLISCSSSWLQPMSTSYAAVPHRHLCSSMGPPRSSWRLCLQAMLSWQQHLSVSHSAFVSFYCSLH